MTEPADSNVFLQAEATRDQCSIGHSLSHSCTLEPQRIIGGKYASDRVLLEMLRRGVVASRVLGLRAVRMRRLGSAAGGAASRSRTTSPRMLRILPCARYGEIAGAPVVMPGREPFAHDRSMSGACVGTARTGVCAYAGRLSARARPNLLLAGYSGKEIHAAQLGIRRSARARHWW